MKLDVHVIDAFTNQLFKGNSAAVIVTKEWLSEELMQSIAMENNLSETAYLVNTHDNHYDIRWFSPLSEIDFCGHATLASAFVLFAQQPSLTECIFHASAVGALSVVKKEGGFMQMNFPNRKPEPIDEIPDALLKGLSITPTKVLRNQQAYFAVYEHEQDVSAVTQDTDIIKTLAPYDVVVTAASEQYDFVSRYFWPANGGDEDPVTGSIHTGLAPYWAERLQKNSLIAYQASVRGGVLHCNVSDERVAISGQAVRYMAGQISL